MYSSTQYIHVPGTYPTVHRDIGDQIQVHVAEGVYKIITKDNNMISSYIIHTYIDEASHDIHTFMWHIRVENILEHRIRLLLTFTFTLHVPGST